VFDTHSKETKVETSNGNSVISPAPYHSDFPSFGKPAVPAADGPFYLWFPPDAKPVGGRPRPPVNPPGGEKPKADPPEETAPSLKMLGSRDALALMKDVRGLDPKADPSALPRPRPGQPAEPAPLLFHQRAFLIPAAELLAVLSADGTKVHVHAFKPRELMDKSGTDYLVLMGRPPQIATPGQKWTYTPDVWSKKGGVKVEVVKGPAGMTVTGTTVEWEVPKDLLDNRVTAELKITDASGKAVECKIPLSLDGTAPNSPTITGGGGSATAAPVTPPEVKPAEKKEPAAVAPKPIEKAKAKLDDALVGTWAVKDVAILDGGFNNENGGKDDRMVFQKDGTCSAVGVPGFLGFTSGTFTTDPTATPKALDVTTTRRGQEDTRLATYQVDGDTLKVCVGRRAPAPRPEAFAPQPDKTLIITLKRVKEEAKPPVVAPKPADPKPADPKKDDAKGKEAGLVGSWAVDKYEMDGKAVPVPPPAAGIVHKFDKDGGVTVTGGPGGEELSGTYKVDTSASPKTIDLTLKAKNNREQTHTGVYELDGDSLKLVMPPVPGGPRPKDVKGAAPFAPVMVLKRVKEK
jgi:uncharacterized protein (TIGR03067 family)